MDIYSLEQILAANLTWNRARIKFLARFLIALFQVQTVNLARDCLSFRRRSEQLLPTIRSCKGLCVFFDFASGDGAFNHSIIEAKAAVCHYH